MSDTEKSETAPAAAAKKRSKLLVIGVPVVVLLAGAGGGGWYYMKGLHAAPAAEKKVKEAEPSGVLPIDPFTVNLSDPGGRRYLRVALQLVLPDEEAAAKVAEEELVMARVRSELPELLSARSSTDLNTPEGRAALKHSIAETAGHAGHMDVRDVLFQEFVVQ